MEGLKLRLVVMGCVLASFGVAMVAVARPKYPGRTEKWMESMAPHDVDGFTFPPSPTNAEQSYRMDQLTYDSLKPYGIVARRFEKGDQSFDAVLIAGQSGQSFHNPLVCFTGGGYDLSNTRTVNVETKSHGVIPITLAHLNKGDGTGTISAFCYKSPYGFHAKTATLRFDLLKAKLLRADSIDGVFYRFIEMDGKQDEKRLLAFAANFIDKANQTSNGYF